MIKFLLLLILVVLCWPLAVVAGICWFAFVLLRLCLKGTAVAVDGLGHLANATTSHSKPSTGRNEEMLRHISTIEELDDDGPDVPVPPPRFVR